jgi:hypothetical protein
MVSNSNRCNDSKNLKAQTTWQTLKYIQLRVSVREHISINIKGWE